MSFESFKSRVNALISKVPGLSASFTDDAESKKFFASCSDGTTIIGNSTSLKLAICWGSGHMAMI